MSSDSLREEVPRLRRRAGDCILANENNSTLILGRDRSGGVDSGYGDRAGSGAAHLVVGRTGVDPDISADAATLYLSARTDPDSAAGTSGVGSESRGTSGAIIRADCIRIVPRHDIKITAGQASLTISSDGRIVLRGEILLGEGASDRVLKGDAFAKFWASVIVQTPNGPASPLPAIPDSVFSSSPVRVR